MDICSFDGNADVYGLGIRLGLYFQWFTTLFASLFVPEECDNFVDINASFLASILIALVYVTNTRGDTLQSGSLYAVEIWILLVLCMAGQFARVIALIGKSADNRPSKIKPQYIIRQATVVYIPYISVNIYALWFYSIGMYRMTRAPCVDNIFIFERIDLFGQFRYAALAIHSAVLLAGLVQLVLAIPWGRRLIKAALGCVRGPLGGRPRDREMVDDKEAQETRTTGHRKRGNLLGILFVGTAMLVVTGVIIEVTIKYNHIQGVQDVDSTGQLIPLVIASVGFIQLALKVEPRAVPEHIRNMRRGPVAQHEGAATRPEAEKGAHLPYMATLRDRPDSEEWKDKEASPSQPEDDKRAVKPHVTDISEV